MDIGESGTLDEVDPGVDVAVPLRDTVVDSILGNLRGRSVKDIAAATNIKSSTLYKWKTTDVRLSPNKADALLLYFIHNEPQRLEDAEIVLAAHSNQNNKYNNYSPSSSFDGKYQQEE